ncbi:MAG: DUF4162 domain-containing protein, partial [Pseudolabrys sp.]
MRQRLGVAEILMKDEQIAFLDEPTSGLDPQATLELLEIIRNFRHKNASVLLSSHMLERVQSVCDRVALFNKGSIVLIGTIPELGHQVLGGGFHVELEAEGQGLVERLANVPGVTAVEAIGTNRMRLLAQHDVRPDAAAAVIAAGGRLLSLSIEEPSLDDIYTRYFQKKASH